MIHQQWQIYFNCYQKMVILSLKKRVNRGKCNFATKQRMFGVFAIEESNSPIPALLAALSLGARITRGKSRHKYHQNILLIITITNCQLSTGKLTPDEVEVAAWAVTLLQVGWCQVSQMSSVTSAKFHKCYKCQVTNVKCHTSPGWMMSSAKRMMMTMMTTIMMTITMIMTTTIIIFTDCWFAILRWSCTTCRGWQGALNWTSEHSVTFSDEWKSF